MIQPVLYRNAKGFDVTTGSYSARETFRFCPHKFELTRKDGWTERERRASAYFGKCIEKGIQFYEQSGRQPGRGAGVFAQAWEELKELSLAGGLTYTDCEGNWEGLLRAGIEMERLYEVRAPHLPIVKPEFQVQLRKTIFPNSQLDVLQNVAYIDMLSYPGWNHPALASIEPPVDESNLSFLARPVIIDIKTSGVNLDTDLVGLDPQLAEYVWQYRRSHDAGFLWFVKRSHGLEKRDRVTLLESVDGISAGTELFVLGFPYPPKEKKPRRKKGEPASPKVPSAPPTTVYLGDAHAQKEFSKVTFGLNANSDFYKQIATTFFQARFVVSCRPNQVTKQRLQFAVARFDEEAIKETGLGIGQTTVEMIKAHNEGFYPKHGGIRFPNNKCSNCSMRGICAGKPELRDALLTRSGEEWMDVGDED